MRISKGYLFFSFCGRTTLCTGPTSLYAFHRWLSLQKNAPCLPTRPNLQDKIVGTQPSSTLRLCSGARNHIGLDAEPRRLKREDLLVSEIESPAVPWAVVSPGLSSFMISWAPFWLVALTSHTLDGWESMSRWHLGSKLSPRSSLRRNNSTGGKKGDIFFCLVLYRLFEIYPQNYVKRRKTLKEKKKTQNKAKTWGGKGCGKGK